MKDFDMGGGSRLEIEEEVAGDERACSLNVSDFEVIRNGDGACIWGGVGLEPSLRMLLLLRMRRQLEFGAVLATAPGNWRILSMNLHLMARFLSGR